jgi:hypothetical protein
VNCTTSWWINCLLNSTKHTLNFWTKYWIESGLRQLFEYWLKKKKIREAITATTDVAHCVMIYFPNEILNWKWIETLTCIVMNGRPYLDIAPLEKPTRTPTGSPIYRPPPILTFSASLGSWPGLLWSPGRCEMQTSGTGGANNFVDGLKKIVVCATRYKNHWRTMTCHIQYILRNDLRSSGGLSGRLTLSSTLRGFKGMS